MKIVTTVLVLVAIAAPALADAAKAQRCAELAALWDKYGARRGEGSQGAPSLDRAIAGQDCQAGRYDRGIKSLEEMLRRIRVAVPPGALP